MKPARMSENVPAPERDRPPAVHDRSSLSGSARPPSFGLRSLLRLQSTAGNSAVTAHLVRRRSAAVRGRIGGPPIRFDRVTSSRATTAGSNNEPIRGASAAEVVVAAVDVRDRPFDLIQRQAVAEIPPPPVPPPSRTPEEDPRFISVEHAIAGKAAKAKNHPAAKAEVKKSQDAAVAPPDDERAQAKAVSADKMAAAKPGTFDKAAFVAAVKKAIDAAAPKNLEEADKFGSSGKADAVKTEVKGKVTTGKQESAKDITDTTKAPPDPSVAKEKPVTPLAEAKVAKPAAPAAERAMPAPAPPEQTDLRSGKAETDTMMGQEDVSKEQLEKSNEPEFQAAAAAKDASDEHAEKAPAALRAKEAATLAAAKLGASDSGKAAVAQMGAAKGAATGKVGGDKATAKAKDEAERTRVATEINAIYDATKKQVDDILGSLDDKVDKKFDAGEAEAKRAFTQDHKARMDRYKDDRYSGVLGAARWTRDLFAGLPAEANDIYKVSRQVYERQMETVIGDVADLIGAELQRARDTIGDGREKIRQYVAKQPKNLRKVAQDAARDVADKFDQLESDVDSKQESLVSDLANKYVEAAKAVDEEIKAMQEANKGFIATAVGALAGVVATLRQLKDMLFSVLARAAGAVKGIIKDPIGFLGNLVNAVKAGIMGFADRILEHLKKGLLQWLFGELANAGIELPEKFDLKGILKLILSLLGLTYANIRARAVKAAGPKVVEKLEQGAGVFKILLTEGPAGLWKFVVDKIGDLKEQVLGQIKEFVVTKIVVAGITWLISLLNPASAFIKACKAIVDIVMFLVNKASQIKDFVEAVLDSVEAIVAGGAGKVASLIEGTLAKMIPLLIGFLASLLGLGGISEKIKSILEAIQKPVNKVIDAVIKGALKVGKKLFGGAKAMFGKGKAWVKGKVEAGKKWVKTQAKKGRTWARNRLGTKGMKDKKASEAVKTEARKLLLASQTQLHTIEDLRAKVTHIAGQLKPQGLLGLDVVPGGKEGEYDIFAEASARKRKARAITRDAKATVTVNATVTFLNVPKMKEHFGAAVLKDDQGRPVIKDGQPVMVPNVTPAGIAEDVGYRRPSGRGGGLVYPPPRDAKHVQVRTWNTGDPVKDSTASHAESQLALWVRNDADKQNNHVTAIKVVITGKYGPCPGCADTLAKLAELVRERAQPGTKVVLALDQSGAKNLYPAWSDSGAVNAALKGWNVVGSPPKKPEKIKIT